ncbi:MAG: tellurite resistance/C4-dicarboxylate transporter family protein [Acetobacteraceae bacterium]|nr:tellurite resistance/C4-dicarboxylate transporter family protein [Acetobacteraceae bacterium]
MVFSVSLWVLIGYAFLILMTIGKLKPFLETGINGTWLLMPVATQSLVVLGTSLKEALPAPEIAMFACMSFYALGAVLYLILIAMIFYRWEFVRMHPNELSLTFWINSGAASITVLAGARLLSSNASEVQALMDRAFVAPFTLLFWAAATWWIPLLVLAYIWRYAIRRVPVSYRAAWWSVVFPVGMYATCTREYARAVSISFLEPLSDAFTVIAVAAWAIAAVGVVRAMLFTLISGLSPDGLRRNRRKA